jgi:hypothetical protein
MADPTPDIEEMLDALFLDEGADFSVILGVLGGGSRHGMIKDDRQPVRDRYPFHANTSEDFDNGGRIIMREHSIWTCVHHLTRDHLR